MPTPQETYIELDKGRILKNLEQLQQNFMEGPH